MSEHLPEAPPKSKGLQATLQKKVIGPVPLWLVIGVAGGVVLLLLKGRGGSGGASTPDPTQDAASGALDATGSASGTPADVAGGGDPGANVGGFEDPSPLGPDTSFDFGDPGVSANPPASDPVFNSRRQVSVLHASPDAHRTIMQKAAAGEFGKAPSGFLASFAAGLPDVQRGADTIVHRFSSPAGRIAATTTPFSTTSAGAILHASSAAKGGSTKAI